MKGLTPNFIPEKPSRIVVAMSGGVDSSVTAGWLKEQGHEVIGISLQLHDMAEKIENEFGTCCSLSDIMDARRVAEKLQIPFYVNNMEEEFREAVVDDFIQEYLNGRTPNPCIRCNEKVKFRQLMDWALDLGADYLATGHYAKVLPNSQSNQVELFKGGDSEKD
ncbi:tRNA 2-thiouridine(34) synthase MnmA, partial [bacterium]|nr:tRNA 2-thiouridine(34) synthase MnmA [bacterium]